MIFKIVQEKKLFHAFYSEFLLKENSTNNLDT